MISITPEALKAAVPSYVGVPFKDEKGDIIGTITDAYCEDVNGRTSLYVVVKLLAGKQAPGFVMNSNNELTAKVVQVRNVL